MKLLLVSATALEIQPTIDYLQTHFEQQSPYHYKKEELEVTLLVTGVGMPLTSFAFTFAILHNTYDLAIQAGVAGAIDRSLALGEVVEVVSDAMADIGVEEKDASFTSAYDMGLIEADVMPFREGRLWNQPELERAFLPKVHGITVNKVHGSAASIEELKRNYPYAQVESMEGAAFFFVGLQMNVHLLQLRAISNYVEPRNRAAWKIKEAVANLNEVLVEMLDSL